VVAYHLHCNLHKGKSKEPQHARTSEVGGALFKSERFHKEVWYLTVTNIGLKNCREVCAAG
jgi:hypothetical protein